LQAASLMAKLLALANLKIQQRSLKDKHKEPNTMSRPKLQRALVKAQTSERKRKQTERGLKRQRGKMRYKKDKGRVESEGGKWLLILAVCCLLASLTISTGM